MTTVIAKDMRSTPLWSWQPIPELGILLWCCVSQGCSCYRVADMHCSCILWCKNQSCQNGVSLLDLAKSPCGRVRDTDWVPSTKHYAPCSIQMCSNAYHKYKHFMTLRHASPICCVPRCVPHPWLKTSAHLCYTAQGSVPKGMWCAGI